MSRFAPSLIVALALAWGGSPATAADAPKPPPAPPKPPAVTVVTARTEEVVSTIIVSGTLAARDEVMVQPEVENLAITDIMSEQGDTVKKGQVLAKLSPLQLEVQMAQNAATLARNDALIAQARAQIADSEATRAQAANALQRAQSLRSGGFTSEEQFDTRQAASRSADARLQLARDVLTASLAERAATEAQRREIELKLARTDIRAPRSGLVSRRTARVGALASMAGEPLFRIIAEGSVELEADVPEADLIRLKPGLPVSVTPAGADAAISGAIRLVSPEVDKTSRLGKIRVALDGDSRLAVGGFARGVIEIARRQGVTVPLQALTYGRSGSTVQVVSNGRVATRPVKIGLVGAEVVEIAEGLASGETVVARAGSFVHDGDPVTPVESAPKRVAGAAAP